MQPTQGKEEKIKKICAMLKQGTLDPARIEADEIIAKAKKQAAAILEQARSDAKRLLEEAAEKIKEKHQVLDASMHLACQQSLQSLMHKIEEEFFAPTFATDLCAATQGESTIAKMVRVLVEGVEKEGIRSDVVAYVAKHVKVDAVNAELGHAVLERLKGKSVVLGDMKGGASLKLVDKKIKLDLSYEALKALLMRYVREDFRKFVFHA